MIKAPVELALVKGKQFFKTHLRPINSNPANNSIVVGVEDQDNEIVG
jgi:hypothetical protein